MDEQTAASAGSESQGSTMETMADEIASGLGLGTQEESREGEKPDEPTATTPPAAAATPKAEPEAAPDAEPPAPVADANAIAAPSTWTAEAKAKWAALDPTVQREVAKREQDFLNGIQQYKAGNDVGVRFYNLVQPHGDAYARAGANIWDVTREAVDIHAVLSFGSERQKAEALGYIFQKIGFDPAAWAQGQPQVAPDGRVLALEEQVRGLRGGFDRMNAAVEEEQLGRMTEEVERFANAKLPDGTPKYPYFNDVALDMKAIFDSGRAKTLDKAYEMAVWENAATREREVERKAAERYAKLETAAREKAAKAAKARAVNVSTRESAAGATSGPGSLDDTLRETLAEINSRGLH